MQTTSSYGELLDVEQTAKQSSFTTLGEVKEYLSKRGFVETRKRDGVLKLAGDVRARWIYSREDIRDPTAETKYVPLPVNRYRSEFHLYVDYHAERNWMTSKMNWTAVAGGEATAAGLDIDRAFLGYRLYKDPETKTDCFIEIGRSGLGDLFESEVQFHSNFDGIHLYFSRYIHEKFPYQMIIHGGPFVVNMTKKHYAWAVESIVNRLPKQFFVKMSVVDWNSFMSNESELTTKDAINKMKYKYCVWQWLVGKYSQIPWLDGGKKTLYLYGAVLMNSLAKATKTTLNDKQNLAWFIGGTLGTLRKAKDWSATLRYEYVEALAVPEIDISGIGRGNPLKFWFAQAIAANYDPKEANGFTNYKGMSGLFMYSFTDSLSFRAYGAYSCPADNRLGSDFTYRKFDLGLISAF
ncbi:hypothetical protein Cs308_0363 [Candidatus Chlamydia sanziniae]|uniref:Uncharacterized protein n=2 Tax=Candidatus Chlamydia sanziniae TaxID=1806891 RepID=A0A1A9HWX1_9CHLA|nr:hypothetical protein Cs308_0363 [Candidatus Chlamydia sanziniae]